MKAAIASEEDRGDGVNNIIFEVDELNYNSEVNRIVTKENALDGTVITTNWGYPEGNVAIILDNVILSRSDYDLLISMKEDDDYDFLFCYKNSTWKVVIQAASGVQVDSDRVSTTITVSVIEKYADFS